MKRLLLALPFILAGCGKDEDAAREAPQAISGQAVYEKWCAPCHADGIGHPGTTRLRIDRGEEFSVLLKRTDLTADYIGEVVRSGFNMMPPFRKTEISDAELTALSNYLLSQNNFSTPDMGEQP